MTIALTLLLGFVVTELAGYWVHRLAHWPRGGAIYRAHMVHHEVLYGTEFLSDTYRNPPASSSSVLAFLPFFGALVALFLLALPWPLGAVAAGVCLVVGWTNSRVHDRLHVRGCWLERLPGFARLRLLHRQHHADMSTNFGILSWLWDRAFRTYRAPAAAAALVGPHGRVPTGGMRSEFLVAVSVVPGEGEPERIELCAILAEDASAAMRTCSDPRRGVTPRGAVPLEGDVLALWNELGKAAFGLGR